MIGTMENTKIKGWVAVDSDIMDNRRVSFFSQKPVRDLLTEHKYWAATLPYYESVRLSPDAFPDLRWEDEPIEVELVIKPI